MYSMGITTIRNNNGANQIRMADVASGNQFNQDIIIESINGGGVAFSLGNGDATLAATRTITVGGLGFNSGTLTFRNFTQVGATPQNLTLTGTGYMYHQDSDWGGDVEILLLKDIIQQEQLIMDTSLEKKQRCYTNDDSPGVCF